MKIKNLFRCHAAAQTLIFGSITYIVLSDPSRYQLLTGEAPLGYKIAHGTILAGLTAVATLGLTDGLSDLVYGTYHNFGLRVSKFIARNNKKKEEIQDSIDRTINQSNQDILVYDNIKKLIKP